jgi:hypothetical protein
MRRSCINISRRKIKIIKINSCLIIIVTELNFQIIKNKDFPLFSNSNPDSYLLAVKKRTSEKIHVYIEYITAMRKADPKSKTQSKLTITSSIKIL